jgi:hypothetical protein
MHLLTIFMFLILSNLASAAVDSGLHCTMSYSDTNALSSSTDSSGRWIVSGQEMEGSAVGVDASGLWTSKPANYISVKKNGGIWLVKILNDKKVLIGSFSFPEKEGMKATLPIKAFRANQSEDPAEYSKLEVSCQYTVFAG